MQRNRAAVPLAALMLLALLFDAKAATYTVGPSGRQFTQLVTLFERVSLAPGDLVLVDGDATYRGGIVVGADDRGASGNPVIIRWNRARGQTRPVLRGGTSTIKFEQANHVVFEGFEVTGGSFACVFSEAHDVVIRDNIIHDCPAHGVLAADQNSGSLTFEYNEVFRSGAGSTRHSMYIQSDEVSYPGAVFRMRFNYVHSGNGGILMRTRHERSEIYYNWFEGSTNQEAEFIGPDCLAQKSGWTPALRREDADFVGNVVVHTSPWRDAIRAGGDLNGQSQGRVRLAYNTIVFPRDGAAVAIRVLLGLEHLEASGNVIHQAGSAAPIVLEEEFRPARPFCAPHATAPWSSGRKVSGSYNWVTSAATHVPPEWSATLRGVDPLFVNFARRDFRPRRDSPLVGAGEVQSVAAQAIPPSLMARYLPPPRSRLAPGRRISRSAPGTRMDIGAYAHEAGAPDASRSAPPAFAAEADVQASRTRMVRAKLRTLARRIVRILRRWPGLGASATWPLPFPVSQVLVVK